MNLCKDTYIQYCTDSSRVVCSSTALVLLSTFRSHPGRLPSPENVHIKEHFNSSIIEWKPPYSTMNNESDIIHVDPHITQYTVYITDNYTGNIIVKENVTETCFTFINQGNVLCPVYQVSAWNVGGEGELSEPVQDGTPQGIASYPGHVGGEKSSLVSTVCACANDSGNFSRTSPIMDKSHVVVMRRNNQTRYTAYSVAAVFTRRRLPLSETQARQGLRYNHRQFHRHCTCS